MSFLKPTFVRFLLISGLCLAAGFSPAVSAQNLTLRIVTYNIEDDITNATFMTNATTPLPGLIFPPPNGAVTNGGVLEGIGEEIVGPDAAQPIDILALQETSGNPSTVVPIVNGLNAFYSAYNPLASNMYSYSAYQGTESGGATNFGNGPNAVVYNTHTVQLLASVPVDPVGGTSQLGSSSGEYREVMRYEFAPAGQAPAPATEFYIYVSHYKSGSGATNERDRAGEGYIIRTNEAASLPANARVIYLGDYNVTTSGEVSYQTIVTLSPTNGITQGQGVDPYNASAATNIDWSANSNSILLMKTEDATFIHYRDDFQICTTNVYSGAAGGLALVQGTYHTFGNNGTTGYEKSVTAAGNTALNNLAPGSPISASQLFLDLTDASDHLPVVADYSIPVVQPTAAFSAAPTNGSAPLAVTFTDASSGIVTNRLWNFGDGTIANITNSLTVTHIYTNAGVYGVAETVAGPGGNYTALQGGFITVVTPYQAWQLQYFGCTNCPQAQTNADADGTGQNNLFKYVAGLNPTNAASIFTFTIGNEPNQPAWKTLTFSPVMAGRTYLPLFTTDLAAGSWSVVTAPSFYDVTNGNTVTITDTNTIGVPQKFYDVEITLP